MHIFKHHVQGGYVTHILRRGRVGVGDVAHHLKDGGLSLPLPLLSELSNLLL
jgi:hypothetical protein